VQDGQHPLDILYPALGLGLFQEAFFGGAHDLGVEILEHEAALLGLGLGEDLPGRIAHFDRLTLRHVCAQCLKAGRQFVVALVQRLQALAERQLEAGEQQLQGRGHHLPRQAVRKIGAAAAAVGQLGALAGLFQIAFFDDLYGVDDDDQNEQTGQDQSRDH